MFLDLFSMNLVLQGVIFIDFSIILSWIFNDFRWILGSTWTLFFFKRPATQRTTTLNFLDPFLTPTLRGTFAGYHVPSLPSPGGMRVSE